MKILHLSAFVIGAITLFCSLNNDLIAQTRHFEITNKSVRVTEKVQIPVRLIDNNELNQLTLHYNFQGYSITEIKTNNTDYKLVKIKGFGLTTDIGKPALPVRSDKIALPPGSICKVTVISTDYIELDDITIYPAQKIVPDGIIPSEEEWYIDKNIYDRNTFLPQNIIELKKIQKLRGTPLAFIEIYPVQYNPYQKKVRIYTSVTYRIDIQPDPARPSTESDLRAAAHNPYLHNISINLPDKTFRSGDNKSMVSPEGYIIITHSDFLAAAEALANWKRQLGYKVEIVSQSYWTTTQVKNDIQDRYDTWNPAPSYFVIIGDQEFVPDEAFTYEGLTWYSALYYACMDGYEDNMPDMASGRIPVNTESEALTIVQKIIDYEKNPPAESSFYQNALHSTYFEHAGNGYEGYRYTHTTEETRDYMMSLGYDIQRVYVTEPEVSPLNYNLGYFSDGQPLPQELLRTNGFTWSGNNLDIIDAMMNGVFYIFHRDHAYADGFANPRFSLEDIPSLNNNNRLPVMFSVNCHSGSFQYNECFAEMILQKDSGGVVGIIAPTQETYSGWNDGLAEGLFDAIWPDPGLIPDFGPGAPENPDVTEHEPLYALGDVLNQGLFRMTETWPGWADLVTYERYHYFGDPAMKIWTSEPVTITATHAPSVEPGQTSFIVSNSNCPDGIATVCFNNELMGIEQLENGSGKITFSEPLPAETSEIILTISKHNYRPYQAIVPVAQVMLIAPNGGEDWQAGSNQNIVWSSSGTSGSYMLEYSTNDGANWSDVVDNTPDNGSFTWTVPNQPSVNCLVRISHVYGTPSDTSDALFTISEMPEIMTDSLALVALYNSTNGPGWTNNTNWLTGPVSTWYGITVDDNGVTQINLNDNNLIGTIPPAIGDLSNLTELVLGQNQLSGTIPPEIENLSELHFLHLGYNQIAGEIPIELYNLDNLVQLILGNNHLTGNIPKAIKNLTKLENLNLSNCNFENLPGLNTLTSLNNLFIESNKFTFEDIEPNIGIASTTFTYSPQDSVGEEQHIFIYEGENSILSVSVGGEYNLYQWFKSGEILPGEQDDTLEITSASLSDAGAYTCQITNIMATELTLYSKQIFLHVTAPSIMVNSPNGGEHWQIGTGKQITWSSSGTSGNVSIEYSVNNGTEWTTIIASTVDDGSYLWNVPDNPSTNCIVMVKDADGYASDQSDSLFTISPYPPRHFVPVWTGNGNDQMNFYAMTALIDGIDMQPWDEIGIFDGDICVGAGVISEVLDTLNALEIRVSRDDDFTPEIDGYTIGHTAGFKLWDASEEREYSNAEITYVSGDNIFNVSATTWYHINGIGAFDQSITLNSGWNILSLYVTPDDPAMMTILQSLIDEGSLVKVQNEAGAAIEPVPCTGDWIDNIHDWMNTEGYKLRVNVNTSLFVTGPPIELPLTIPLEGGWNIIGYPVPVAQDAMNALDALITAGNLVKVQNETGAAIEPIPGTGSWINNIHDFMPNEGYKVRVTVADELIINGAAKMVSSGFNTTGIEKASYFKICWKGNGLDHLNIYLGLTHSGLCVGDEIGIFDDELCVGAGRVLEPGREFIALVASADDLTTPEKDGFAAGNTIRLKVWHAANSKEYRLNEIEYLYGTTGEFERMGTAIIAVKSVPEGVKEFDAPITWLGDNYPNPFGQTTTIPFAIGEETVADLAIYDILGQRLNTLVHGSLLPGFYTAEWKGTNHEEMQVMQGIYFVKLVAANRVFVKSIIISRD